VPTQWFTSHEFSNLEARVRWHSTCLSVSWSRKPSSLHLASFTARGFYHGVALDP
jgi:hypothetical protein